MSAQLMSWSFDTTTQRYIMTVGAYRASVWQDVSDGRGTAASWGATVAGHNTATAAFNFASVDEAQAWCEAELKARLGTDERPLYGPARNEGQEPL